MEDRSSRHTAHEQAVEDATLAQGVNDNMTARQIIEIYLDDMAKRGWKMMRPQPADEYTCKQYERQILDD